MSSDGAFRVIIAGCRDYNNYNELACYCDKILSDKVRNNCKIVVVSGHCRGVDAMGERYARERGYDVVLYPAEWDKYGKSAGQKRNELMAKNADALIAVWDGVSKGTGGMIEYAKMHKLAIRVKRFERE